MVDLINQQTNSNWLDFSKGFQYKDQNLSDVEISEAEDRRLKHERMQKYLWVSISNSKPKEEEVRSYIKWLSSSERTVYGHLLDEGYSYNEIVAYMDQKDKFADPMAVGTWIFQKKPNEFEPRNPVTKTATSLVGAELGWLGLEKYGTRMMKNAYWENKKDVLKDITYKKNKELVDFYSNKGKWVQKQIDDLIAKWWDEEELSRLQAERERLAKLEKTYSTPEPTKTADVAAEFELVWDDRGIAVDAWVNKTTMFTEDVLPAIERSQTKWKITDFLDELKYEDFADINEYDWKEYEKVINDMKEVYAKTPEKSLYELYDWKKRTWLSNNAIKWDESKAIVRNIQDKLYTKVNNAITTTLDAENEWAWIWEKIKKYWLLTEVEEGAKKWAVADASKANKAWKAAATPMELAWKEVNKVRTSKNFKTKLWKVIKNAGKYIRPSTYLSLWKDFLTNTLGLNAAKVDGAIKWLGTAEKLTWKTFSKFLWALWDLAEPLVVLETGTKLKKYEDVIDVMPMLQAKVQRAKWWKWFEDAERYWRTEDDWENIWLWKEDVREILTSQEFDDFINSITWGGSKDFVKNSYAPLLK